MRSYLVCSLVIAMVAAAGCGDSRPGTDARDSAGDKNGDGSPNDRMDAGGGDSADVGTGTGGIGGSSGGSGGATGGTGGSAGATGGTGGSGGSGGSSGNDGGAGSGNDGGGVDGAAPSCADGVKNGDETGIDCGGHCGKCAAGGPCLVNADCQFSCRADKTCAACNAASDCPGDEKECVHRTCTAGVCGSSHDAAGTVLTVQTTGDCKRRQCAADGSVAVANDDTDVPEDHNPCTNDICTSGTPSHTLMPASSNCGGANHCNATGQCIGCSVASDCPGTDTSCRTRTCSAAGVCDFTYAAAGTKLTDPTAGDCKALQCDGLGNEQVVNDNADLPVDNNVCTTDECSSGTPSHRPVVSGTACGGSLVCDGASHCVECLSANTCPGTDAECHTRSCVSGACGVANIAAGTLVAAQTARDCKKNVCNGQGGVATVNDDLDLPVDSNACTFDVCTAGTPSNPNVPAGNSCGATTICNGQGACVTCLTASSCPGTDTECHHRTCTAGVCGIANTAAGTPLAVQIAGDCKRNQCDGAGAAVVANDDLDKPVDGNTCTDDVCTAGVPSNPNVPQGTTCGPSLMCNAQGACVGCITAANCGTDTFCQTHTCSTAGVCGVNNTAAGTAVPAQMQTAGDCKKVQCDGHGQQVTVNDDTDKPVDGNACTKDVCNGGIATNPPEDARTPCNQSSGTMCNGSGTAPACVECLQNSDCGTNTDCQTFTCANNHCVTNNVAQGTATSMQAAGDCKKNVCNGQGASVSMNDDNDVHVDGNPCTSDLCSGGMASNPLLPMGTTCGPSLMCDAQGACVGCITEADCPLPPNACQQRVCKTGGVCDFTNLPNGTLVTNVPAGDCHHDECDGGLVKTVIDDTDLPSRNGNTCMEAKCTLGVATVQPFAAGTICSEGTGVKCDGAGACVECLDATVDCPEGTAPDSFCQHRSCTNGMCGTFRQDPGTPTPADMQTPHNCKQQVCDGAGTAVDMNDDSDLPEANQCQTATCTAGVASTPAKPHGTSCTENNGRTCDGSGACQLTYSVVRVGTGATLTNAATATFIEEHVLSTGALVGSALGLPTADAIPVRAFTESGTASSDGELTLSGDGKYLAVAGYNRSTTVTGNVVNASAATVNRIIARIDAANNVDTTTLLGGSAFSGNNVRGVTTIDGTSFWVGGAGGTNAGVWYIPYGQTTPAPVQVFNAAAVRWLGIYLGQLYGTSNNSPNANVFTVGSGTPTTTGQSLTSLPGMATGQYSPFGFVVLDRDGTPGADTVYMADDGNGSMGAADQGIQKWTFGTTAACPTTPCWTRVATINAPSPTAGFRGLTGFVSGSNVVLIATTNEASGNRVIMYTDDGTANVTGTLVNTAASNTVYRGVALSPHL
jgi:hypothetical protein